MSRSSALISRTARLPVRLGSALVNAALRYPWVAAPVLVMLLFMGWAVAMSIHVGVPIRDPDGALLGRRMVAPFLFMGLFMVIDSLWRARGLRRDGDSRATAFARTFHQRWWWRRAALSVIGFWSFALTYLAYRNLKSFTIFSQNFHTWGPTLRRIDEWFCFGRAPADVLQDWLGRGAAAQVLSVFYLVFIPLVPISVAAALTFLSNVRDAYLYVTASMFCWILGTISYYILPSLGPYWEAPWQFDQLPETGVQKVQAWLYNARLNMYADPIGFDNVNGVAAFASLHVGVVVMAMLVMWRIGHRRIAFGTLLYGIPTVVSTMYFGWHYILDDFAGLFIGWLSVVLAGWCIYPSRAWFIRLRRSAQADGTAD